MGVGCYSPFAAKQYNDHIKNGDEEMKRKFLLGMLAIATLSLTLAMPSANAQKGTADYDVQHYKIDAELIPSEQLLRAKAEVKFIPQTDTRTAVFEMNGSLAIKTITRSDAPPTTGAMNPPTPGAQPPTMARGAAKAADPKELKPATPAKTNLNKEPQKPAPAKGAPAKPGDMVQEVPGLQFIQDSRENMNVRVDLGSVTPAGKPVTLVFEYEGALESAQGGPIATRLAFIGDAGSYLFYAARWFPFHEYAADRATYEINLKVPKDIQVAGYSEQPVAAVPVRAALARDSGRVEVRPRGTLRRRQDDADPAAAPLLGRGQRADPHRRRADRHGAAGGPAPDDCLRAAGPVDVPPVDCGQHPRRQA